MIAITIGGSSKRQPRKLDGSGVIVALTANTRYIHSRKSGDAIKSCTASPNVLFGSPASSAKKPLIFNGLLIANQINAIPPTSGIRLMMNNRKMPIFFASYLTKLSLSSAISCFSGNLKSPDARIFRIPAISHTITSCRNTPGKKNV